MIFTANAKATMLDALSGTISASLHTTNPTAAGDQGEISGGSYSRQTIAFAAADTAGNRNASSLPTFEVPGSTTVSHMAFWLGGNCIAYGPVSSTETFNAAGQYKLTDADLTLSDPV